MLIAAVSSIVEIGEFKLGLVQQGLPYRKILETRVIPRCPETVLRIHQRVVGNQVMLYVMNGDGHRFLEQPVVLEFVRVHQRADKAAVDIFFMAIIRFTL